MLEWSAPALWIGLSVALLVPLIHIGGGAGAKRIDLPTAAFLNAAAVFASKRMRLRDGLLILLRVLLMSALALTAARPALVGPDCGDVEPLSGEVLIMIDSSLSMAQRDPDGTRLDKAIIQAKQLISSLAPDARVGLWTLTGDETTVALKPIEPHPTLDHSFVAERLNGLSVSPSAGRFSDILKDTRFRKPGADRTMIILTDASGQFLNTEGQATLNEVFARQSSPQIALIDVSSGVPSNGAVVSLTVASESVAHVRIDAELAATDDIATLEAVIEIDGRIVRALTIKTTDSRRADGFINVSETLDYPANSTRVRFRLASADRCELDDSLETTLPSGRSNSPVRRIESAAVPAPESLTAGLRNAGVIIDHRADGALANLTRRSGRQDISSTFALMGLALAVAEILWAWRLKIRRASTAASRLSLVDGLRAPAILLFAFVIFQPSAARETRQIIEPARGVIGLDVDSLYDDAHLSEALSALLARWSPTTEIVIIPRGQGVPTPNDWFDALAVAAGSGRNASVVVITDGGAFRDSSAEDWTAAFQRLPNAIVIDAIKDAGPRPRPPSLTGSDVSVAATIDETLSDEKNAVFRVAVEIVNSAREIRMLTVALTADDALIVLDELTLPPGSRGRTDAPVFVERGKTKRIAATVTDTASSDSVRRLISVLADGRAVIEPGAAAADPLSAPADNETLKRALMASTETAGAKWIPAAERDAALRQLVESSQPFVKTFSVRTTDTLRLPLALSFAAQVLLLLLWFIRRRMKDLP